MRKLMWNHINPPDYLDFFIQRIQFPCAKRLKKNPEYQELNQEKQELLDKYPVILKLLDS